MEKRTRASLVAAGSVLALGAALLPVLGARLALGAGGAGLLATGLGLAPASALFCAAGYAGSAALAGRGPRGDLVSYASLAEIGTALALFALLSVWRRGQEAAPGPRWAGALGVLLAFAGFLGAAHVAGLGGETARWSASLVASPVLVFALAGCASRERSLVLLAAYLALRLPERCGFLAAPAALGLALVAAEALASAPRAARVFGAAACALLAACTLAGNPAQAVAAQGEPLDAQDQWVQWRRLREFEYEVEVDARVPVASVVLAFVSETGGARREWPMQRSALAAGARFTHARVCAAQLPDPAWRVELELLGRDGAQTGVRVIDRLLLPQAPAFSPAFAAFLAAGLLLGCVRGGGARLALVAALVAAAQAVWSYALV